MRAATSRASSSDCTTPSLPGTVGTLARRAVSRARALSPIVAITCESGPTKIRPAASTCAANAAFSDRKP